MVELSNEQIIAKKEHQLLLARIRNKKYYQANKQKVLNKQKEYRDSINDQYNQIVEQQRSNIPEQIQTETIQEEPIQTVKKTKKNVIDLDAVINFINNNVENANTKKYYISSAKMLFRITECTNLNICLKNNKKIIKLIDNAETANGENKLSLNSRKHLLQTIIFLIDKMDLNIPDEIMNIYKNKFEVIKEQSKEITKEKTNEPIISYVDYLTKIKEQFGISSKEYLIVSIYGEAIVRDNFDYHIITNKNEDNGKDNFLLLPRSSNATILLNNYKTVKKYGKRDIQLSNDLNNLVRLYIKTNKINKGDLLFGKGKLTQDISKMNRKIGIKGGVNILRRIAVSSGLKADDSIESRVALANKSMHSINSQQNIYKRVVND